MTEKWRRKSENEMIDRLMIKDAKKKGDKKTER